MPICVIDVEVIATLLGVLLNCCLTKTEVFNWGAKLTSQNTKILQNSIKGQRQFFVGLLLLSRLSVQEPIWLICSRAVIPLLAAILIMLRYIEQNKQKAVRGGTKGNSNLCIDKIIFIGYNNIMKRLLMIMLTVIMCFGMVSCSKVEGTYTATCDNMQHGVFDVFLELKSNGKFSLYAKHKTMDIMDNIRYNGTYKIDKSNDGSQYDTLILYYNEYNEIDNTQLESKTKKCKINTKGTMIILTNFFAEAKITLKKKA